MDSSISTIHYCPVKSLSFTSIKNIIVKKNLGISNDRIFAFTRNIDFEKAMLIQRKPLERKLNYFLTLKNSPILNKYKFFYNKKILILYKNNKKIISIESQDQNKYDLICNKLLELEASLTEPIYLLKNEKYPFFDTTHSKIISNSISLINLNSIKDFESKTNKTIEPDRFRGNLYIEGLDAWKERNWIDKVIKINQILFKVVNHIPRCSATNLLPNTDKVTINLPITLKKHYNHFDMGVYLCPLENGEIKIGDKIILDE